ncbi:hypothetical protein B0H19DRAFT_1089213 [Mycena capillaripes]|nr:hypothetical protein B0H19DRAFT_1089213 [Mycena capillaripes]
MTAGSDHDSPILLLPPEIIVPIFEYCLPFHRSQPLPHEAPLLLAQICRRWREICLDSPNVWACINFGNIGSPELLKAWLLRARNHPLTIFLHSADGKSYCVS